MWCSWTRHCSLCAALYPDVQLKLEFNAGVGLASLSASFVHATDQSHTQDSANLQHFYFLPETSWSSTVISATMGYNLQYNNVARQAEGNFCSYYQIEGNKNAR